MNLNTAGKRKALGYGLVMLQFACMLLLALLAFPAVARTSFPPVSMLLAFSAGVLAFWILMHNRLGNFNIQPAPKRQGILVTSGPYRWIRHPMYTTVMLGTAALAVMTESAPGWAIWAFLTLVLWVKSAFEERWMQEQHPAYSLYMQTSKRFIPLVL